MMFIFIFMLLTSKMLSTLASTDNYNVIKEPTIENPTFEVEGDVTYQWYKVEESQTITRVGNIFGGWYSALAVAIFIVLKKKRLF